MREKIIFKPEHEVKETRLLNDGWINLRCFYGEQKPGKVKVDPNFQLAPRFLNE